MNKARLIYFLKEQGFSDKIVSAFEVVDRTAFVPPQYKEFSYIDEPLPIGFGQTISQPYTIAFMLGMLDLEDRQKILEVGSGSGYVLALMNEISKGSKIYGIERIPELAERSKKVLKEHRNIKVVCGDGTKGVKEYAPYDRILVSASADAIPTRILRQLNREGIMVCVVKDEIFVIKRRHGEDEVKRYPGFYFVELVED